MSQKHNKRTRAQILAKRAQPVREIPVRRNDGSALAPLWVTLPTHSQRLRATFAKQQARYAAR